jgi:hypothetical protein
MARRAAAYVAAIGVLAGLAGGLAEVIWIWTYAGLTSNDAGLVAHGVTNAVRLNQNVSPVAGGIAIHMGLASILGVAVALALRPFAGLLNHLGLYATVSAALVVVWAVNFFVFLPLVSPQFVAVVPYTVSLISKVLFGITVAAIFQWAERFPPRFLHA